MITSISTSSIIPRLKFSCSCDKIEFKPSDKVRINLSWRTDQPLTENDVLAVRISLYVKDYGVILKDKEFNVSKYSSSGNYTIEVVIPDLGLREGIYDAEIRIAGLLRKHLSTAICVIENLKYIQPKLKTEIRLEKTKIVKGEKIETIIRIEKM